MTYQEHPPACWLLPYVDCYWTLTADDSSKPYTRRVIPDICADIILNLGPQVQVWNGQSLPMKPESAYLVGTMTTFQDTVLPPGASLTGIRFKPFGLTALVGIPLHGLANKIELLDGKDFSLAYQYGRCWGDTHPPQDPIQRLDAYFSSRLPGQDNGRMNHLIGTILQAQGQVSVSQLTRQYGLSERQLERKFTHSVGVSLQEVSKLTRFQHAYQLIQHRGERSLLDIAFQAGYYDHAHLTRHIKRYAGRLPSQVE